MSLTTALEAYCHAIACGADRDQLGRAWVALTKAHHEHAYETAKHDHETRMSDYQEQRTT